MALLLALAAATLTGAATDQPDVRLISQGRQVTLEEHLVPGKLVVFDFYADWCAPCRYLTPRLERLADQHPDRFALRKIDVVDWESPVARQHSLGSLPHLVLFGPDGTRLAEGDANKVLRVLGAQLGIEGGGSRAARGVSSVPTPVWFGLLAALVIGSLVVRRRGRAAAEAGQIDRQPAPVSGGGPPQIWLVMGRGGLEGPYSVDELARLQGSGALTGDVAVRRRGDASWRRLADVIDPP